MGLRGKKAVQTDDAMWLMSRRPQVRDWMWGAVGQLLPTTWIGGDESLNQGGEGKD